MERNTNRNREKCRSFKAKIGCIHLDFNPVVTIISAVIIWAFVIWCVVDTETASNGMKDAKRWITETFTWLYIGTQDVWFFFLVILYFSKYGKMKLGKDHDKPEFSNATYFTMLFSAGIAIGLFYYAVAEPIFHYVPGGPGYNRYWGRYTDNQRAQDAINITLFHWGAHAWVVYSLVGVLMGLVSYRQGLPMTIRSCFHPLIGDMIYGWVGDVIDILSVIVTMFGVCTSLGLGVITLNSGINRLNSDIDESTDNQIIIIWLITVVATISVISGLRVGIRRLSEICFCLGMTLMLFVLFSDNTWFLLNLYVQSIGYYFQWLIQLGFHTDAFAQLGNAPDKLENPTWMDGWTIFYWGWWIAWSAFVGMFIAKVSRGRTIRNVINATMTAPILYSFFWLCIFGGVGIKMEREAELNNVTCNSVLGGGNSTASYNGLYRLSCRAFSRMFFDVLGQYGDNLEGFLFGLSLATIVLYFVTSSDSGSLVIDCLSANGSPEPPVLQRIFWALTEGACATALLKAGGRDALDALQTVSIAGGLIYTVIICFMCISIWKVVKEEAGESNPNAPQFSSSILAVLGCISAQKWLNVFFAAVFPWYRGGQAAGKIYNQKPWPHMLALAVMMYAWIALEIAEVASNGLAYIGWVILFGFFAYLIAIRVAIRNRYGIQGSLFEDALAVIFMYPLVVDQMHEHVFYGQDMPEKSQQVQDNIGMDNPGQLNHGVQTHEQSNGRKFEEAHF
ncbi:uncharacterized protein LOC114524762 [Dendronephthya gigantea]|uniref:uncharacterized protein LOC114524762 n=1 Tax=Dendronephthya gigantea TaxID=151771 RepID=UPI00106CCEF5|nr:uncharacterized protein LOC114524762 [Dendronephthya gigantea]